MSVASPTTTDTAAPKPAPLYYLELSANPIRFDAVSQLTNVFFDDSNRQVFAVRSGGATGIVVKGPLTTSDTYSFRMDDKGPIRSIKFTADNRVLAVQRTDLEVEFIDFLPDRSQPRQPLDAVTYRGKNGQIFGFVWIGAREVAVISSGGIELLVVNMERKLIKSVKSLSVSVEWFSWSSQGNLAVLATNGGQILWPVLLKPGTITKLPKLVWKSARGVPERDLTLAQIYGISAILILQPTTTSRLMEVVVYLLNGPGLAPQKAHLLRLGLSGRFAMNIVDDIIVVHHQATGTSMLFDIGLNGQSEGGGGVLCHEPLTAARSIRPMALPMPSLSFAGQTKSCELYSVSWVLFQPDIVIDAKLGCLWYVQLNLDTMCTLIKNRVQLVEFLLQRTDGKPVLIDLLKRWLTPFAENGDADMLAVLGAIFDRINVVYERLHASAEAASTAVVPSTLRATLQQTCSSPKPTASTTFTGQYAAARVCLTQIDLYRSVFAELVDQPHIGTILIAYLGALARLSIPMQDELGRMLARDLVRHGQLQTLRKLLESALLQESKVLACYLLSLSGGDRAIQQMALDMLAALRDDNIIVEVLLGQGKVTDALRLAIASPDADSLPARKYLEAAQKSNDPMIFYSVYTHFVERNVRLRGSPDFAKSEMCQDYIEHYRALFVN